MTEATLKSQLEELVKLQKIDKAIHDLTLEKEANPLKIKELEAAFEQKKAAVAAAEKQLQDVQKLKKEKELELAAQEENAKKLQAQLYSLKTNKEYQAMLQQIQDAKADASVIEDKILELFDSLEKAQQKVEEEKGKLRQEEAVFEADKKKLNDRVKEIEEAIAGHQTSRREILPNVDKKILAEYERIMKSRDGIGMVPVRSEACTGCFMRVNPQTINLIKMYESLVTCEVCNRILYVEE
ncbi:MAG: C4-type zinc ribbon domain-containing protein [Candidatus Omnitrophica bacterium]|nr:C4-type zinc ribbon domain-containing protein [Candidatus Omnitrophota bacterium]